MGITSLKEEAEGKEKPEDSFEKYYNKDLDLDEGKLFHLFICPF